MRSSKLHHSDVLNESTNGPRPCPSPLRINKISHPIHKSSSFPATSFSSHHHHPVSAAKNHGSVKRQPVIIYTQSPRIIHTQAHEFMTLVQKLTGLDRAIEENEANHAKSDESESTTDEGSISNDENKDNVAVIKNNDNNNCVGYEENESSSVVTTDEKLVARDLSPVSSMYEVSTSNMNNYPYLIDGSFLGSDDFYCSSRSNSMFGSANQHQHPISPSFMDIMKGFPEY